MEDFLLTVLPRSADTGGILGQLHPNLFCAQKILFYAHDNNKSISPLKMYFVRHPQF